MTKSKIAAFVLLISSALVIHALFISYGTGVIVGSLETREGAWGAEIFDSFAKNFLKGRTDLDPWVLGTERLVVNGREYMYYGPFPAFVRMPLNALFPNLYGTWTRLSCLIADGVLLLFFALLLHSRLRLNARLSETQKNALFYGSFLAFALGSPVVFLMSASYVFHETILWAFAWSAGAVYYLFLWLDSPTPRASTAAALGLCAAGALLSRVTFGAPWLLVIFALSAWLCVKRPPGYQRPLICVLLPLAAMLLFQAWYNEARFGSPFTFTIQGAYQPENAAFQEFFTHAKTLDVRRIPFNFYNYFLKPGPYFTAKAPWIHLDWASMHPTLHRPDYKEWLIPIPLVSLWLILGAAWGAACLFRKKAEKIFWWVPLALSSQWLLLLAYFTMTHRYSPEFFPLLMYFYAFFLSECAGFSRQRIRAFAALCALAIALNVFSTLSWLVEFNFDTPARHRESLRRIFL